MRRTQCTNPTQLVTINSKEENEKNAREKERTSENGNFQPPQWEADIHSIRFAGRTLEFFLGLPVDFRSSP